MRRRWLGGVPLALVVLVPLAIALTRFVGYQLRPQHVVLGAAGPLDDAKRTQLDAALAEDRPLDRDDALAFALSFTAKSLSFSLDHPISFTFGTAPRSANCAEYSYLFASAFDAAAKVAGSTARAYRIRSMDPVVFGKKVPLPGFRDHDWVLIVDPADKARFYVDPTFYDLWLGSSLARNVVGGDSIEVPK